MTDNHYLTNQTGPSVQIPTKKQNKRGVPPSIQGKNSQRKCKFDLED